MEDIVIKTACQAINYYEDEISKLQEIKENEVLDKLRPLANLVVNKYKGLEKRIKHYQEIQLQAHKIREQYKKEGKEETVQQNNKISKKLKNDFKDFYTTVIAFQSTLQKVQGIKMKVSFVGNGGIVYEFDEITFLNELKNITRVGYSSDFQMQLSFSGVTRSSKKTIKELEGQNLYTQKVYKEILKRASVSKKTHKEKSKVLILWQTGSGKEIGTYEWDGVVAMNMGDIREIYLKFIYNNKEWEEIDIEKNVGEFMIEVLKVDNASGALIGDFTSADGFEIAAKSFNSTLLKYQQLLEVAEVIASSKKIKKFSDLNLDQFFRETEGGKGTRNYRLGEKNVKIVAKDISSATEEVMKQGGFSLSKNSSR